MGIRGKRSLGVQNVLEPLHKSCSIKKLDIKICVRFDWVIYLTIYNRNVGIWHIHFIEQINSHIYDKGYRSTSHHLCLVSLISISILLTRFLNEPYYNSKRFVCRIMLSKRNALEQSIKHHWYLVIYDIDDRDLLHIQATNRFL